MCVLSAPTVAKPKKKRRKKRGDLNQIVSSIGKGYKPRKMTLAQMLQMIHEVRSWPQLGTVRDSLYLRAGCMWRKMAARSTRTSKSMTRQGITYLLLHMLNKNSKMFSDKTYHI